MANAAIEKANNGYKAIKMNATPEMDYIDSYQKIDDAVGRVDAIRQALGKNFGIAVDFHGRVHQAMARILIRNSGHSTCFFVEEPVSLKISRSSRT